MAPTYTRCVQEDCPEDLHGRMRFHRHALIVLADQHSLTKITYGEKNAFTTKPEVRCTVARLIISDWSATICDVQTPELHCVLIATIHDVPLGE